MVDIWHLSNYKTPVMLWGTDGEEYITITAGNFSPILTTGFAIFVNNELSSFFSKYLHPNLLHPVVIMDKEQGIENREYHRLTLSASISPETITYTDASGLKVWHHDKKYLFVSKEAKDLLEKKGMKGILFSRGFSFFG